MKKILLLLFMLGSMHAFAQKDSLSSVSLGIGQDSFFGFYVSANGAYSYSDRASITFYTNYWANPAFGNAASGSDFWTEVGLGVNYNFLDKKLNVNPSIGLTYGKVLSGGEKGVLGDGIVPSAIVTFSDAKFDFSAGVFWFKALREEGPITVDYEWFWLSPAYKLNQKLTVGVHFEKFYLSRITEGNPQNLYTWIGPSIQYNFPKGSYMKVTGGYDTENSNYIRIFTFIPLTSL